ncbi:MAG: hypothetical protein QOI83_3766, partial [Streptomycetaceae bacterium]|nr:hypothetical protein [Streptomycetaceae bacterium]
MRTQRQEPGESSKSGAAGKAKATDLLARSGLPAGPARIPQTLLGLQQSAGNAAATRALRQPAAPGASRVRRAPGPTPLAAVEEADESRLELPPYLLNLQAAGVSTAYDLTGHKLVHTSLSRTTGQSGGTVAEIRDELAGRPETFYGRGRSFAVKSPRGSFDVTVRIAPDTTDRPETFPAVPGAVEKAGDGKIKMDAQHNSSGAVSHTLSTSSQYGASLSGIALAPTPAPAMWAGAAFAAGFSMGSSAESRTTRTMSEPRVLRSEGGTVQAHRKVRYRLRVEQHGAATQPEPFHCVGSLTMRVPREHLVPVATTDAPSATQTLTPQTAREVRLADSMAPLAVTGTGATHAGGGGLYDTVGSVLHPSLTAPGSAGRARLYEATSTTSVLEDLPRLLSGWVAGEDLAGKGGKEQGAYRMRADILSMTPAWSLGKTQLRTHQQAQHGAADSAGKSAGVSGGVGPGMGLGAPGAGPSARAGLLPRLEISKGRYTVADQTVNTRQGAEVRGEKVLYRSQIRITVEGTGPTSPRTRLHPEAAEAHHTIEALITMRADEAKSLGVALPGGVTAGELFSKPTAKNADGTEKTDTDGNPEKVERHLPFGATGSSVALGRLNARPLIAAVERLFAENSRFAGYLPAEFLPPQGAAARAAKVGPDEAENQRRNYRELVTVLSETNLRANKDQLLSSGIRVRLRRKSTWHAHDVQIRVGGEIGPIRYVGDTSDWLVRSSSGVSSGLQSGGSSARGASVRAFVQAQVIPGAMSLGYMGEIGAKSSRRNQAGPTTRTDSLNNGGTRASAFGSTLTFDVKVTMTTRARTAKRALTLGSPGQDSPEVEEIASSAGADEQHPLKLDGQDVRLTTSTALTMNAEQKKGLDGRRRPVRRKPTPVETAAIGDVTAGAWSPGGKAVRDWVFVETVGDGGPVRDLAFRLLAQAAGRGHVTRRDHALKADGLAPRLAIEDRLSPQAITAALRQATASGWVVKNLRYPRRLAELTGAVGTRFALTRPVIVHDYEGEGPGTENLVLGGHQATGQRGTGRSRGTRKTAGALENGAGWRMTEGLS